MRSQHEDFVREASHHLGSLSHRWLRGGLSIRSRHIPSERVLVMMTSKESRPREDPDVDKASAMRFIEIAEHNGHNTP